MVNSNDVRRLFLQAVLSRGVLSTTLAQKLWAKCIDAVTAADDSLEIPHSGQHNSWDAFVAEINTSLDSLDLEFRHLHDENTGREMYALVNRKGDEIAQMATDYSPAEIAYFRAIVEQIMLAPNESFCVSSMAALREVNSLKTNMSKAQAEIVLGSFVANGWLHKSKRGRYTLSTRSLLELLPYLKSTYPNEIIECTICMEIITRGVACYTANCKTRLHFHCFNAYRRRNSACPTCSKDWHQRVTDDPLLPVGEGAARNSDDVKRRVRQRGNGEESSDEDEEFDEDSRASQADQSTQASQSQPARSQRSSRKAKAAESSMEVDQIEGEDELPTRSQANGRRRAGGRRQ